MLAFGYGGRHHLQLLSALPIMSGSRIIQATACLLVPETSCWQSLNSPDEFLPLRFVARDLHAHAAVDRQAGTRDEARLIGAKENSGVGHVTDLA